MKRKFLLILVILVLGMTMVGCSSQKDAISEEAEEAGKIEEAEEVEEQEDAQPNEGESQIFGLKKCGEVYKGAQLSYNIIGVRTKEYSDGVKNLILKLEVFNHSSEDINFSAFDRLTVFDKNDVEYGLNILADVETDLIGTITPENKIMGETAFEITDSNEEDFVLNIGNNFEYKPAIEITKNDIDKTFLEQFAGSGTKSEYTIGVPLESKQLTILLKSANVKSSDKEGKEILLCELDITNKTKETQNFMLGLNFNGVYTADGVRLNEAVNDYTLQNTIEENQTINGIASFYIEEGRKDFYMTVTPDLNDFGNKKNIVFSVE